ncbi:bifunctional DNA primase/polymerase [Streptomyces sp. RS10V-4]|uniref:bifunctional DNA primase/polymerase n=1 Tax=Streptomyces rhizoryzae TaxID=2932493 RepID=UPI002003F17D|nr:bifunctional DNA primase/polymerase [Streptomyces rhizoryzae]MCK7622896.1 bifunctional DNA primase/polymerase [Streptomyces rhizoryzae]
MEDTIGVTGATRVPQQRGEQLLDTAVRYAEERHWEVFPGAWLEHDGDTPRCSCRALNCPLPGAHPTAPGWAGLASGSATAVRRMWSTQPRASILLPTGRTFEALDVPETAGFLALARMERLGAALGPVTRTPDRRMLFLVLPGAAAKVPDLVRALGWAPAAMDLVCRGEGEYIAAPPTRVGPHGAVQWVRRPTASNRWLPDAEELLSPLAYACARDAAALRGH